MKAEKVVEEFLKLVTQEKVKEAEELIVEEAKEREDEVADYLLMVGIKLRDEGYHVGILEFCTVLKLLDILEPLSNTNQFTSWDISKE